jgi:hypothetical protein
VTRNKQLIHKLLGVDLESIDDTDIDLHQEQPNPMWKPHTTYMRLRITPQDYDELVEALDLTPIAATPYHFLLPGKWKLPEVVKIDWWTPTLDTPQSTAARAFGDADRAGWILAKYEDGYAYLRIYDGT